MKKWENVENLENIKEIIMKKITFVILCLFLFLVSVEADKIVVEAEKYISITPSMVKTTTTNDTVSNHGFIQIPLKRPHATSETGPSDNGACTYKINISQNGTYTIWLRANWYDSCGNSFFVIIDNKPAVYIESSTYLVWHWVKGPSLSLSAGSHTIKIQNREDGAKLDQFLLINNSRYVPTRIERATQ
jgi:hypothetical protein